MSTVLPDKTIRVHAALADAGIPHAFGGAIALAFYGEPRFTRDIDINIALPPAERDRVLGCLATEFVLTDRERAEHELDTIGQARLTWDDTLIDLFFATVPFHESLAGRTRYVNYCGTALPVISPEDLIVLKATFNRPKDWLDIEAIFDAQRNALDIAYTRRWLPVFYAPPDDRPIRRVEELIREYVQDSGS